MPWNKTDRSFKTLINKRVTDSDAKFYFNEKGDFTINTHQLELWVDAIPSTAPGITTDIVEYHNTLTLVEDTSVPNKQAWFATSNASTVPAQTDETSRLKNWVSDKYGSTYEIVLYDTSNVQIPPSDGCGWFFDYQTGILTFASTTTTTGGGGSLSSRAPFKIKGYRYIGRTGLDGNIIKNEVRVATTPATSFAGWSYSSELIDTGVTSASLTIDGISLNTTEGLTGDRILIKNWSTLANNGIYYVERAGDGASDTWRFRRAPDFNDTQDVFPGTMVFVRSGTVNARTVWSMSNASFTTLDAGGATGEITFAQFITATTRWSALTAPDANLSLSMSTYTTTFNWATGTSTNNLFSLTTDASANGTGALLNLATGTSSTVLPLLVKAGGTTALTVNASAQVLVGTLTNGRVTYAGASGLLQDSANMTFDGNRISLATTGNTGGLLIGGDANLYRSATDTLKTDDSFVVGVNLSVLNAGTFSLYESGSVNFSSFVAGTQANDLRYTLPTTQPSTNQVLTATSISGSGPYDITLSWVTNSASITIGDALNSGTAGSILFVGTGPVLAQDNANLYWDDTNNTFGIGTTRTGAISGTNPNVRILGTGTTSATSSFEVQDSATATLFFIRNDGYVGIGTNAPTSHFYVTHTLSADTSLTLHNNILTITSAESGRDIKTVFNQMTLNTSGAIALSGSAIMPNVWNQLVVAGAHTGAITIPTYGLNNEIQIGQTGSTTHTNISGIRSHYNMNTGAAGTITTADSIISTLQSGTAVTTTLTTFTHFNTSYSLSGSPVIGTLIGLDIKDPGAGTVTTQYGIRVRDQSRGSANYAMYFDGTSGLARQGIWWNGDVNLYRSAADTLKTDDSFVVGANLSVLNAGTFSLYESGSTNFSSFAAGTQAADLRYTLPTSQPTASQVLTATSVTGAGPYDITLGWVTNSASITIGDAVNSGTAGSILFVGTGPVLAQDNANLYWDDANNTLGIGTTRTGAISGTNPSVRILGTGTSSATSSFEVQDSGANTILFVRNDGAVTVGTNSTGGGLFEAHKGQNDDTYIAVRNSTSGIAASAGMRFVANSGGYGHIKATSDAFTAPAEWAEGFVIEAHTLQTAGLWLSAYTNSITLATTATNAFDIRLEDNGTVGFGLAPSAHLHAGRNLTLNAWGTSGAGLRFDSATYTDSSSSGTVASAVAHGLAQPTFAASVATTYTNAASLYISNAPASGANVTITNAYALWVDAGIVRFDGNVQARDLTSGRVTYAGTNGLLQDSANFTFDGNRLALATTGNTGGLLIGGDANLYRSAADVLKTDDSFIVGANLSVLNAGTLSLYESGSVNFSSFVAGTQAADLRYTLPTSQPSTNQVLTATSVSGAGPYDIALGWSTPSGGTTIGASVSGGTAGSILFVGTGPVLAQDNANFYWDDTNNTLGIGTTRTGAISGTNPSVRILGTGTSSATSSFEVQDSGAASLFLIRDDGLINFGSSGTFTNSTGRLALSTTGSGAGILIGGDANLYRSAADTLKTDDSFVVGVNLSVLNAGTLSLYESGSINFSSFAAGTQANDIRYTLPTTQPSNNQILTATSVTGGGPYDVTLTWVTPATSGITIGDGITGSTVGSVLFVGAGSTLAQDNANFYWDDTNNTLGIGTTRSGAISGTNPSVRILGTGSSSATSSFEVQNSGANPILFVRNDSRVGIGTNAPSYDLSLGGEAARTIGINRRGTGAGNNLTVQSGGAQSGGTNLSPGTLILSSGIATGNAAGYVDIYSINNSGLVGGTSDNPAVIHARFGTGRIGFGTTTLTYDITLHSMVSAAPYTYAIGMLDSTIGSGHSLNIQAGHVTTTADLNGGSVILTAGNSTGSGSSSILFYTATAGGSGTTVRTSSLKMTLTGAGQLQVSTTGSSAGILLGGDAQIYRSAADTLRTPDSLIVDANLTVGSLTSTRVPFASTGGLLVDSSAFTFITGTGQLVLSTTGSSAGILIGGDAQLYRSAADTLRTPDSLTVDVNLTVSGTASVGAVGGTTGTINLVGSTSGTVSVLVQAAAGTYNFNLPTTAGSSGHVLTSAGGAGSPMTWTDPASLAVRWNSIVNPNGNQSLSMSTHTTTWNWATGTSTNNLFNLTTDASANGTGALLRVATGTSSTVVPMLIVAAGTTALTVNASAQVLVNSLTSTRITYAGTNGLLQDSANMTFDGNRISLATTGNTGGLLIGGDANLYRSAADTLKTDDSFVVGANLSVLNAGTFSLYESGSVNFSSFVAGTQAADLRYTLPTSQPSTNQVLTATSISGAGPYDITLGWAAPSATISIGSGITSGTDGSVLFVGSGAVLAQDNSNFFWDDTNNYLGLGTAATPAARLHVAGNQTASAWTTNGVLLRVGAATLTDSSSSGTVAASVANAIQTPTFAASSVTTYTDAATLYISANPTAGTNVTITNGYALWVDSGATRLDGNLIVGTLTSTRIPYASTGGLLVDSANMTFNGDRIALATTGNTGGLLIGGDTNLYRSSADVLSTDDSFTTGGSISAGTNITASNGYISTGEGGGGFLGEVRLLGDTSGTVSILPQSSAGTYNFNLPTTAGSAGEVLTSGGGGGSAMTWTAPGALAVRWNSLANPTGNQSLTMSTNTTAWNWATGTSTNNLFNLTTDASANGTGALLRIATGTSSTVVPMLIVAAGTTALTVNASAQVLVNSLTSGRVTFAGTSGLLTDSSAFTYTTGTGQLALSTSGSGAGVLLGGDALLYRDAADILRTPDSLRIDVGLGVGVAAPTSTAGKVQITGTNTSNSVEFNTAYVTATHSATGGSVTARTWGLRFVVAQGNSGGYTNATGATGIEGLVEYTGSGSAAGITGAVIYARSNTASAVALTRATGIAITMGSGVAIVGGTSGTITNLRPLDITWDTACNTTSQTRMAIRINPGPAQFSGSTVGAIWFFSDSGTASDGLLWGQSGDTNLYRSAANTLKTDDSLVVTSNLTVNTLTSGRVTFAGTSGLLSDSANFTYTTGTGQLALATTGSGAGILIGGDANLYRSAANTLKTDDSLVVGQAISSGVVTLTDGATPALDASLGNTFLLTAAGNRTIAVPTNPTSGQKITIVHKASGADRTLALNTGTGGFRFGTDITGLTATTSGLTDYIGAIYNSADNKWDVVSYVKGF